MKGRKIDFSVIPSDALLAGAKVLCKELAIPLSMGTHAAFHLAATAMLNNWPGMEVDDEEYENIETTKLIILPMEDA